MFLNRISEILKSQRVNTLWLFEPILLFSVFRIQRILVVTALILCTFRRSTPRLFTVFNVYTNSYLVARTITTPFLDRCHIDSSYNFLAAISYLFFYYTLICIICKVTRNLIYLFRKVLKYFIRILLFKGHL